VLDGSESGYESQGRGDRFGGGLSSRVFFGAPASCKTQRLAPLDAGCEARAITAIYQKIGLRAYVGGVVMPTNIFMILAPYLAVIGLVATAAVAIKKRRN